MSLRGPVTTSTPRGRRLSLMGRMGRVGRTEYQKGPLILFIFCGYIDKVYIYLYTKKKLSPTFLWVSKFDVKLGVVIKNFKFTPGR